MQITDIVQQVKNKKRYSVFLDGEFAFGIDGVDLLEHRLEIGQKLERDEYVRLLVQLDYTSCRDVAVKYLGRGLKSKQQVLDKLHEKEFSPISIERVVELLTQRGYINDVEYAVSFINHKTKVNNFGRRRIEHELARKGISPKDTLAAYAQIEENTDGAQSELELAQATLIKKTRNRNIEQIKNDPKELNRLKGYLVRRGFDFDIIDRVLSKI